MGSFTVGTVRLFNVTFGAQRAVRPYIQQGVAFAFASVNPMNCDKSLV